METPPYIVLLVEDDGPLHQLSRELLEEFGYEVISASNGVAAVKIIDNLNQRLDVVFSDVKMPDNVSGFEVAKHLAVVRPAVPILLTTGYSEEVLKLEQDYIAVEILTKPYNAKLLNSKIRDVIEGRKG